MAEIIFLQDIAVYRTDVRNRTLSQESNIHNILDKIVEFQMNWFLYRERMHESMFAEDLASKFLWACRKLVEQDTDYTNTGVL
jgi:hypothetical protein